MRKRPEQLARVRELRRAATDAERRLWRHLRNRRFHGLKFRRQVAIGPFIVDFCCLEAHLIVELDGGQHAEAAPADAERTRFLQARGFCVVRFWNNEVLSSVDAPLAILALTFAPHPNPLPARGARGQTAGASSSSDLPDDPSPHEVGRGRG